MIAINCAHDTTEYCCVMCTNLSDNFVINGRSNSDIKFHWICIPMAQSLVKRVCYPLCYRIPHFASLSNTEVLISSLLGPGLLRKYMGKSICLVHKHEDKGLYLPRDMSGLDFLEKFMLKNMLTLKGPIPYIYGTQVWLSLCLQMS